jgi:hypothetical protein
MNGIRPRTGPSGGRGGTYLTVYADDLVTARALTDTVLARIP